MRNIIKTSLPALVLNTCHIPDKEESSLHEEIVDTRFEYAKKAAEMLGNEGIDSSALQYRDSRGETSMVLLRKNNYVTSSTYRVQPYRTSKPSPEDEGKVLTVPFNETAISSLLQNNNTCLVVDGKPETPVEVIEDCLNKLKHN